MACSSGRYRHANDSAPLRQPTPAELEDPLPREEKIYPPSLRKYEVGGKTYYPQKSATGYSQKGQASWYGRKFHGHLTANGEVYNMFAMTAAHKTLPLPSYVKVRNLANGREIIVRVNDRGPFHDNRIIDLSYSAAYKLGMLGQGTANVQVEAISYDKVPTTKTLYKVQVLATSDKVKAQQTADALSHLLSIPAQVEQADKLYRIQLGPVTTLVEAEQLLVQLKLQGYDKAYKFVATKSRQSGPNNGILAN